jgi:hypothetical protein
MNNNDTGYTVPELKHLAKEMVALHFGVHPVLANQRLAFLEALVCELQDWHFQGDIETVLAAIVPGYDRRTYRMMPGLVTDWYPITRL